jgi:hypothetical protein
VSVPKFEAHPHASQALSLPQDAHKRFSEGAWWLKRPVMVFEKRSKVARSVFLLPYATLVTSVCKTIYLFPVCYVQWILRLLI